MSDRSKIEWTDATWNPVRGCTKTSPGCRHCYAETFAERFRGVPGHPYEQGFDLRLVPHKLPDPVLWKKPRMVFVNSMSDLFHDSIPDSYILAVCRIMHIVNWHRYQVLTKRSTRLREMLSGPLLQYASDTHIWWGVSVEDKKHGLPRIKDLTSSAAINRFLSIEPLLEDLGRLELGGVGWVIVGGESGPKSRPMPKSAVEAIRRQCEEQSVPFFFKQWGGTNKKRAGRLLNARTYDETPVFNRETPPPDDGFALLTETIKSLALNDFGSLQIADAKKKTRR